MTRIRSLTRPVTSIAAAAAIFLASLGATATPAAADRDVARFIAGAVVLGIIAHGLSNRGPSHPGHRSQYYHHQPANVLPHHCRVQIREHGRHRPAYSARCLRQTGLRQMPQQCRFSVQTRHGWQRFFGERCIVRAGYRTERGGYRY